MSAFLTGQLQHQGCERGSSRSAALDLHRVERDLEGGGTSIGEGKGGRGGEDWRRGATEAATDVNGRGGREREIRRLMEGVSGGGVAALGHA